MLKNKGSPEYDFEGGSDELNNSIMEIKLDDIDINHNVDGDEDEPPLIEETEENENVARAHTIKITTAKHQI